MSEQENPEQEGALQGEVGSAAPQTPGGDEPIADETGASPSGPHTSTVTDLPEGAEVDPLTDARPQPVEEAEPDDG